jgi:hypothetical protein
LPSAFLAVQLYCSTHFSAKRSFLDLGRTANPRAAKLGRTATGIPALFWVFIWIGYLVLMLRRLRYMPSAEHSQKDSLFRR